MPRSETPRRRGGLRLAVLAWTLASSCALTPSPAAPTPLTLPTAAPTPTPAPRLLVLGVSAESPIAGALREWAGGRGWSVEMQPADQAAAAAWLAEPGVQAAVSLGDPGGLLDGYTGPLVVIDASSATPAGRTSRVGEPGGRHDQVGFLAGVLAGLVSRTERVGLLTGAGGVREAVYAAAFDHGLRYGCPRCTFVALNGAQVTAEVLAGERVDVVYPVPGEGAAAVASGLPQGGVWLVWSGSESAPPGGPRLAGEVRLKPEALVAPALAALLNGDAGRDWPYSVENGSVALSGLDAQALSPGRQRVLEQARSDLESGLLQTGVDPVSGTEA